MTNAAASSTRHVQYVQFEDGLPLMTFPAFYLNTFYNLQEIDYRLEGKNADLFRANFAGTDWVRVPKVFWDYTSPETLVLEYLPGTKINDGPALDRQGLDRKKLGRLAVESYLQQM